MFFRIRRTRRVVAALVAAVSLSYPIAAAARGHHAAQVVSQAQASPAPSTSPSAPATTVPSPPAPAQPLPSAPVPGGAPPPNAAPANAPTVVSVDVSGNAHVPTATILSVGRTRAGLPFDERVVREGAAELGAIVGEGLLLALDFKLFVLGAAIKAAQDMLDALNRAERIVRVEIALVDFFGADEQV